MRPVSTRKQRFTTGEFDPRHGSVRFRLNAAETRLLELMPRGPFMSEYDDDHSLTPHRGPLILVLGILSLVMCAPLGLPAWWMGSHDLAEMRAGRMDREGESLTQAGYITGIIGSIIMIFGILLFCLWLSVVVFAVGAGVAVQPN